MRIVVCFILNIPHLTKRIFHNKGFKDGNHSCYEKQADVEHAFGGVSLLRRFAIEVKLFVQACSLLNLASGLILCGDPCCCKIYGLNSE